MISAAAKMMGIAAAGTAVYGLGKYFTNPMRSTAGAGGDPRKNSFTVQGFREAGFWKRQATIFTLGLAKPQSGERGASLPRYWGARIKDVGKSFATPPVFAGMAAGAGLGTSAGIALGLFSKMPMGSAVGFGAVLGAVGGAYTARKVQLQVVESVNKAKKAAYQKQIPGNMARGGGPGYRSWTNSRTMGKPGHLGMTGSVPFAMHKARHRSTVK